MTSFFNSCEEYFGSRNLYEILQINKNVSSDDVKKAYRRLSLVTHPDRFSDEEEKKVATEKFKVLGKLYAVLSDEEKRKVYDETGSIDEEEDFKERDWFQYWRCLFKEISFDDIENYKSTYIDSETELEDLIAAYKKGKGSIDYIFEHVPFSGPDQEDRIKKILENQIQSGSIPKYKALYESEQKIQVRKRKWEREAKAADKLKKEVLKKKNNTAEENGKDNVEDDLVKAIMQRRAAESSAFVKHLEEKYAGKPKGRAKKVK